MLEEQSRSTNEQKCEIFMAGRCPKVLFHYLNSLHKVRGKLKEDVASINRRKINEENKALFEYFVTTKNFKLLQKLGALMMRMLAKYQQEYLKRMF